MGKTIILIDDDSSILFSVQAYLEDCGYQIFTATNGRAGCELIDSQAADLIITDMRMPEKTGMELIEYTRGKNIKTPIIVLSGNGVAEDVIEALHKGAWDYVLKPIRDFSILTITIERLLEKFELIKEKEQHQEELEEKVAAQTKELTTKNSELKHYQTHLEDIIEERTSALGKTQNLLIDSAHKAGQADIAIDVIHNIGNSMNSINTAIYVLNKDIKSLPTDKLREVCTLLDDHSSDLYEFLVTQDKAGHLLAFLNSIKDSFVNTINTMEVNQNRIISKSDEVTHILNSYRKFIDDENISSITEINTLIENTLDIFMKSFQDNGIEIIVDMPAKYFVKSSKELFIDLLFKSFKAAITLETVESETKKIELSLQANSETTTALIAIHHCIISPELISNQLASIFGPSDNIQIIDENHCTITMLHWKISISQSAEHSLLFEFSIQSLH
ncbi:MAG: response regulator [Fibrobacterales bacterium]